jgi:hypothetical protein
MKLYTQKQVEELLETQRGNCYVAVKNALTDNNDGTFTAETIASAATKAPLPGGDKFERYYGIPVEFLFEEDLKDRELQGNYDSFKRHLVAAKTSYNALVPTINSMISTIVNLKELIVSLSVQGLPTEEPVKRLAKLDNKFTKLSKRADTYKVEMDKQNDLIKKYEDWNERKLFMHWKYLTHLKVTNIPWSDWKSKYKDIII